MNNGLGSDAGSGVSGLLDFGGGWLISAVFCGVAGYFVGKHTGSPVGTAAASALFGLPGMAVATMLAPGRRR